MAHNVGQNIIDWAAASDRELDHFIQNVDYYISSARAQVREMQRRLSRIRADLRRERQGTSHYRRLEDREDDTEGIIEDLLDQVDTLRENKHRAIHELQTYRWDIGG